MRRQDCPIGDGKLASLYLDDLLSCGEIREYIRERCGDAPSEGMIRLWLKSLGVTMRTNRQRMKVLLRSKADVYRALMRHASLFKNTNAQKEHLRQLHRKPRRAETVKKQSQQSRIRADKAINKRPVLRCRLCKTLFQIKASVLKNRIKQQSLQWNRGEALPETANLFCSSSCASKYNSRLRYGTLIEIGIVPEPDTNFYAKYAALAANSRYGRERVLNDGANHI